MRRGSVAAWQRLSGDGRARRWPLSNTFPNVWWPLISRVKHRRSWCNSLQCLTFCDRRERSRSMAVASVAKQPLPFVWRRRRGVATSLSPFFRHRTRSVNSLAARIVTAWPLHSVRTIVAFAAINCVARRMANGFHAHFVTRRRNAQRHLSWHITCLARTSVISLAVSDVINGQTVNRREQASG